ncbi:MAG: potassium transporter TrkG [Lachnospiraceae bacterium]|nr:potassium transporter TrkG [Lachnospiraceae bacterium]
MERILNRIPSFWLVILGFLGIILAGALLLMLPFATRPGESTTFSDALFTATSAVCVTGLVVHDTVSHWTLAGQGIILLLIQLGGLGVVMAVIGLSMIRRKQIGLKQRNLMQDSVSAPSLGGIMDLFLFIIKGFILFETAGALCFLLSWHSSMPELQNIWYSLFHSVSAFCNAGFDLMGANAPFSSLTAWSGHTLINTAVMLLIIFGGIGFVSWKDIIQHRLSFRKYHLQTKIILVTSLLLVLLPALFFFLTELKNLPLKDRLLASLFQSVTTRTAGFNTVDLTAFSDRGVAIMILLMLTGGSPGSTAGGMKTTTLAVLAATAWSVLRKSPDTILFQRRIRSEQIRTAMSLLFVYFTLFFLGGMVISAVEELPLLTCLFETASAIGTVGLTLGITPSLGLFSRIILMFLMFLGRVGGMTVFFALIPAEHTAGKYPAEPIAIG